MSKDSLESKQKLPIRLQEAICDAGALAELATVDAPVNDIMNTCIKQQVENEKILTSTERNLKLLNTVLDDISSAQLCIEQYVPILLDVQEGIQLIERHRYYEESWLSDMLKSDF